MKLISYYKWVSHHSRDKFTVLYGSNVSLLAME